jgi:hypothetical protein
MRAHLLRETRLARFGLLLLVAVVLASCASGAGAPAAAEPGAAPPQGGTVLRVRNTDSSGQALRVLIAPEAGTARLLGNVAPEQFLSVPWTGPQGRYLFRAERPDGSMIESPVFTLVSGTYTWDIALRRVDRQR